MAPSFLHGMICTFFHFVYSTKSDGGVMMFTVTFDIFEINGL
jgi:hypothetical protein